MTSTRPIPASLLAVATLIIGVRGAITPTFPGGGNVTFTTGQACSFSYGLDTTKTWTNMAVDLMSGANLQMVNVTRIVQGVDATTGTGTYNYTCPAVTPNSDIYFYQFVNEAPTTPEKLWTSRFTIAAANGSVVAPMNPSQPNEDPIPWGVGSLDTSSSSTATPGASNTAIGSTASVPLATSTGAANVSATSTSTSTSPDPASPTSTIANPVKQVFEGTCGWNNLCPEIAPCCSEWGNCGTGRSCLAGCNPLGSFGPGACAPVASCQSTNITFRDNSRLLTRGSSWNGDSAKFDFIMDSIGRNSTNWVLQNKLMLTLTEDNGGTRVSSTRSMLYGNFTARMKVPSLAGVVTSFSLISGANDEIDWEFTTANDTSAFTSYFWLGDPAEYKTGMQLSIPNRTVDYQDYGINWGPDLLEWTVNGVVVRNVTKASTEDPAKKGLFHYPQTPSRIQLSIWAAGIDSEPQGTIDWSGGKVDWLSSNYTQGNLGDPGFYAAYVEKISIECHDLSVVNFSSTPASAAYSPIRWSLATGLPPSTIASISQSATATAPTSSPALGSVVSSLGAAASSTPPSITGSIASIESEVRVPRRHLVALESRDLLYDPKLLLENLTTSYIYSGNDTNGQLVFFGTNASAVIFDSGSTGYNMTDLTAGGVGAPAGQLASSASAQGGTLTNPGIFPTTNVGTTTFGASTGTLSPTASPSTIAEKWDSLSTAAHTGVYIGGGVAALLLVAGIGFLWNKASSSRASGQNPGSGPGAAEGAYGAGLGKYQAVDNQGEMLPSEKLYGGSVGLGPGQSLYQGGAMSWDSRPSSLAASEVSSAAPLLPAPRMGVSQGGSSYQDPPFQVSYGREAPATTASAQQYQGGYVPSSSLKKNKSVLAQYQPGYVPEAERS
ncbi:hypothetical protein T439DRAFT_216321 [Meredithblackwellia eburnea MCA 4105]